MEWLFLAPRHAPHARDALFIAVQSSVGGTEVTMS